MEIGIEYLQPMQCIECGTILDIRETEVSKIIVNAKGLPIDSDTISYETYAECPKCKRKYNIEKNGMYYRLYNHIHKVCPNLQLKENDIGFGWRID